MSNEPPACLPCATYGNQHNYSLHRWLPSNVWATIEPRLCYHWRPNGNYSDHWATSHPCFCILGDPWTLFGWSLATAGQHVKHYAKNPHMNMSSCSNLWFLFLLNLKPLPTRNEKVIFYFIAQHIYIYIHGICHIMIKITDNERENLLLLPHHQAAFSSKGYCVKIIISFNPITAFRRHYLLNSNISLKIKIIYFI